MKPFRIGAGAGYSGDRIDVAQGYDTLLTERMRAVLPACVRQGVTVITGCSFGRMPITFQQMNVPPTPSGLKIDFNPPGSQPASGLKF